MSVRVFVRGKVAPRVYEKAQHVRIDEGHLLVVGTNLNSPRDVMAVYAPGEWLNAEAGAGAEESPVKAA